MEERITLLTQLVESALNELYCNDQYLLDHYVHERSVVFRFAHYMQKLLDEHKHFLEFNLDLEYNRNGYRPKRIPSRRNGARPDVIIHKRGSNKGNLLMIEFKTYWDTRTSNDLKKLKEFTRHDGRYNFSLGLSIIFGERRSTVVIKSVRNGEMIN